MKGRISAALVFILQGTIHPTFAGGLVPWIDGTRFSTNGLAVSGHWESIEGGVRGNSGGTISFQTPAAARFYLKIRHQGTGSFQIGLNDETLEMGSGFVVRPGGGLSWTALPDRSQFPAGEDRHAVEIICQDGCLDVWVDGASAGFGSWKKGVALTNGSLRVTSGDVTFSWLEWRGIQPRPMAPNLPGSVEPAPLSPPAPPLSPAVATTPPIPSPKPETDRVVRHPDEVDLGTIKPISPAKTAESVPKIMEPPPPPLATMATIQALLKKPKGITWVFAGDSITLGGYFTAGGRSYPEHFQERIRWEMRRFDDAVINTAFNGATTDKLARVLDDRVLRHHPQVVFLMIGSNDARRGLAWLPRFREWLEILAERLKAAGVAVVFQTANHPVSNRDPHLLAEETAYMQAVREVALAKGIPLIDHWALWEGFHADHDGQFHWMGDPIHPNARGHLQLALDIFRALGLYDQTSRVVKLGDQTDP